MGSTFGPAIALVIASVIASAIALEHAT